MEAAHISYFCLLPSAFPHRLRLPLRRLDPKHVHRRRAADRLLAATTNAVGQNRLDPQPVDLHRPQQHRQRGELDRCRADGLEPDEGPYRPRAMDRQRRAAQRRSHALRWIPRPGAAVAGRRLTRPAAQTTDPLTSSPRQMETVAPEIIIPVPPSKHAKVALVVSASLLLSSVGGIFWLGGYKKQRDTDHETLQAMPAPARIVQRLETLQKGQEKFQADMDWVMRVQFG